MSEAQCIARLQTGFLLKLTHIGRETRPYDEKGQYGRGDLAPTMRRGNMGGETCQDDTGEGTSPLR